MKATLKNIYLNLRENFLHFSSIFFSSNKLSDLRSGQDAKKILFIRIDRIGDMILSTPALKAIKKAMPHSKLVVLASYSNCAVILNNPYIDEIVVYDHTGSLFRKIGVIRRLRCYRFDLAIDPYPDYELRTAIIAFLSGAKIRVGYNSHGREVFFNVQTPKINDKKHFVDITADVLKPLGVATEDKRPEYFLTDVEREWAKNWLNKKGVGTKPLVGLHPGAYYESQRWPLDRFAELANHLVKRRHLDLIVFGGPNDEKLIDQLLSMVDEKILTYVGTDLRRFVALLSCCRTLICNNSGPLHMAVATNTSTISFMGPTDKDRWMPVGHIHKILRIDDLPCIGCNLGYCKTEKHECMRLITIPVVIESLKK
jgi:lipopolysaccharide heptosyltransferase II